MIQAEQLVLERMPRATVVELLLDRDGSTCQYPECGRELDFTIRDDSKSQFVTIDHWMPKHYGLGMGWTWDEIWDLDNLKLMHKKCNAKKGELVPDADGTIPERVTKTFRSRRHKRVGRPEICTACSAGRDLQENEWCNACGSGPQPARLPRWRQMSPKDCDHDVFFCWGCHLSPEMRRSTLDVLINGGPGYE